MKRLSLSEVQLLPNGTRVYIECTGSDWHLENLNSWNIKQEDGLHYEVEDEEHTISFPYNHDYEGTNMDIVCYIESVPCGDDEISVYDGCCLMNFETCQHRKDVDVMGIKKRSLFCDFDDMECDESNGKCRNRDKF